MRHFASPEEDRGLYLIAILQEAQHMVLLGLVIVLVHINAELYFLDGDDFLVLFGGALLFLFFVEEFAVILDFTDRRSRVGGDLNQIKASFAGDFERFIRWQDAKLVALIVYDADFSRANAVIGTN